MHDEVPIRAVSELLTMSSKVGYHGDTVATYVFSSQRSVMLRMAEFGNAMSYTADPNALREILDRRQGTSCAYDEALEAALADANETTLSEWKRAVASWRQRCPQEAGFEREQKLRLYDLIQSGNVYAMEIGVVALGCWEGVASREDLLRSAGVFFDKKPEDFFRIVHANDVSLDVLRLMLSMLPLETVDDFDRRIAMLRGRVEKLEGLSKESSLPAIPELTRTLEESRVHLEKLRDDLE